MHACGFFLFFLAALSFQLSVIFMLISFAKLLNRSLPVSLHTEHPASPQTLPSPFLVFLIILTDLVWFFFPFSVSSSRIRVSSGRVLQSGLPTIWTWLQRHAVPTDLKMLKSSSATLTCSSPCTSPSTAWRRAPKEEVRPYTLFVSFIP